MTHRYMPIGDEEYQMDSLGRVTNRVDASSKDWETEFDELSRVKKTFRPSNNYEEYGYNALGGRTHFWNAEYKPMTFGVDAQGRVTSITNAIGKVTSFTFDDAGNLATRLNAENELTEYGHDSLNRLVAITNESIEVATFDHDNNGNVTSMENDEASVSLGYDSMNRILASTQTVGSATSIVGYQHDLNGNRTHVTYPGNTNAVYVYGADNRLESVDLSAFGIATEIEFNYDSALRLTNIVYPNSVNSTFGLDAEGRVTSIQHGSFIDRTIQRNALGFKEVELIDAGLKPTAPETSRRIKTHNDADQLVSESVQTDVTNWTDVAYSYSDNGCLTNINAEAQGSQSFAYDYDNRIASVDDASSFVEYIHDASGVRVGRIDGATTNYFVVDYTDGLKRPLAETDSLGTVTRYYIWSGARLLCHIEANGDVRYYHSDELGSTLALTDSSGTVTDEFAYMPYGYASHTAHAGSSATPFRWLGGYGVYYDADTDLHLTLYRAYSSSLKRFIHPDPLGIDGFANLYAYGDLNPIHFVDPMGLDTYRQNRVLAVLSSGGTATTAPVTHTFLYTTNPDGSLAHTYSWVNAEWQFDEDIDMNAARQATQNPDVRGPLVGDARLDPYIDEVTREWHSDPDHPSHHKNRIIYDNCKTEADLLVDEAVDRLIPPRYPDPENSQPRSQK